MENKVELLPCKSCKKEVDLVDETVGGIDSGSHFYYVNCPHCELRTFNFRSKEALYEAWGTM